MADWADSSWLSGWLIALAWYWFLRGRFAEARRSLEVLPRLLRLQRGWRGSCTAGRAGAAAVRERCLPEADARAEWWIAFNGSDVGDLATCLEMLEHALKTFRLTGISGESRRCWWLVRSMPMYVLTCRRWRATLTRGSHLQVAGRSLGIAAGDWLARCARGAGG